MPPATRRPGRARLLLVLAMGALPACDGSDLADDDVLAEQPPQIARILPAEQAIAGAHVPTLDPHTLKDAEIRLAIGPGPLCSFHYTKAGRPVLALRAPPEGGPGVLKVNGNLVMLQPEVAPADPGDRLRLAAAPMRVTLAPAGGAEGGETGGAEGGAWREADMVFEIGETLRVGYRGYVACRPEVRAARRS